jgi:hypothetical protein
LVRLLGWREDGKSYQRIDESLKRWLGVSLYYDKAWWDQEEKSWVSESFHILDNVTLYDRERYARRKKTGGLAGACSSFTWNEIVFGSFRAGWLKRLDLQIYRKFRSAVAKRLYRFTDKRFYKKARWEFDLQTLCFDKLGIARTDHMGDLKRRLNVGIQELVEQGILKPMEADDRYRKDVSGRWHVILERESDFSRQVHEPGSDLVLELIDRGLSQHSAREFVRSRAADMIRERIKLHDWLVRRADARVSKRPAGFLAESIRREYPLPEDYVAAMTRRRSDNSEQQSRDEVRSPVPEAETVVDPDRERCLAYFEGLSDCERTKLEAEAVRFASRVHAESYSRLKDSKGPLFEQIRREVIVTYLQLRGHGRPNGDSTTQADC